jgi:hypothetical protein
MRRFLIATTCLALGMIFSVAACAQTADEPASKDDIIQLLNTMRSHDTMQRTMEAVMKPMHEMYHEQFAKEKDRLPPDFEARMNKMMDEMMKDIPFDEMTQAIIPPYQKHFTHGDITALIAFYASPVGQKFLEETPVISGEVMQAMIPIMTKYSQQWQEKMQHQIDDMEKAPPAKTSNPPAAKN